VTDGEVTPDGMVNLLAVTGLPAGALVLAYRISVAPGALIDSPDEILYDRQGRRILLIEGVVVDAASAAHLALSEADFVAVRAAYRPFFRRVWEAEDELPVQASQHIDLSAQSIALKTIHKPPVHLPGVPARPSRAHAASPTPQPEEHPNPPAPAGDPPTLLLLLVILGGVLAFLLLAVRLLDHHDLP
jgi:hypothetical protein